MRKRGLVMLGLALLMGLVAAFLARNWIESRTERVVTLSEPAVALSTVVVARRQLDFGDTLRAEFLREIEWPRDAVPAGSFSTIEELTSGEPRVALRSIAANEPILATRISGYGGRATLSAIISEDMRAVAIRVNDVVGVAGFVLPGDRVDVLLTRGDLRGDELPYTNVLLQNLRVLGIDQEASENRVGAVVVKAVTLEATQQQAQLLTLGGQFGQLSLALRNESNVAAAPTRTVDLRDLRPQAELAAAPARPAVARRSGAEITVFRGFEKSVETVGIERSTVERRTVAGPRTGSADRPAAREGGVAPPPRERATGVPLVDGPSDGTHERPDGDRARVRPAVDG